MRMFAGARKARGRTIRWLSVLPWPPTGLADGFGRGNRPTLSELGPGRGLTPMVRNGSPARAHPGGHDSASSGAAPPGGHPPPPRTQPPEVCYAFVTIVDATIRRNSGSDGTSSTHI